MGDQEEHVMLLEQSIPTSVVLRVFLLGPLDIWKKDPSGAWKPVPKDTWKNSKPARSVFKRLLVQPGRRLSRSTIEDDIWSESDNFELVAKSAYNAISLIRGVIGKSLVTCWDAAYEIADQTLIWTDLDACAVLLTEAENRRKESLQAVPFLEQALSLLERGELLEGEDGRWCYAFRRRAEDLFRQARIWLAEEYEAAGKLWQAGEQYRALILANASDEEALQRWLEMLVRHGKRQEALKCYQDMKACVEAQGFSFSPVFEQAIGSLKQQPPSFALFSHPQPLEDILFLQQREEQRMNYSRRQMLQGMLAAACTTLTLAPYIDLPRAKGELLLASVQRPSYLSEEVLDDVSAITQRYWKLSANASLQLLNGLFGLFQDMTQTLRASQNGSTSERRYTLASEVAQLLGKTLFDLRDYSLACSYYGFALQAALKAHQYDLWAAGSGKMALLLLSTHQPERALMLLGEVRNTQVQSLKIGSWHAAIEAEAYSYLGNVSACRLALERAKDISEAAFGEADTYATGLTRARLASYEGSCYLRLHQPEQALPVLEQALALSDPTAIRRLSRLLTYLGEAHLQLGHERQAYDCASQALDLIGQTCSLDILRHVRKLRDGFLTTGESSYTRDLERRIEEAQEGIATIGGFHG